MITERCSRYISPAGPTDVRAETEKIADVLAMYQTSRQEHVEGASRYFSALSAATVPLPRLRRLF